MILSLLITSEVSAQFDREWKIFVVPFSHVDVGFTAPVPVVIEQQSAYIDSAIAFVERTASYPPKSRFKWSTEITWPLEDYLETRPPEQIERLMGHVRAGSIEINAMHFSLQTDLCGPEELVRSLYFGREIERKYDVTVRTAVTNDTPGFTWSLAQLLNKAEVPYFSLAMNSFLSNFYTTTDLPNLFYWEGQSGDQTLVWRSIHPQWAYLEGIVWGVYSTYANMNLRLTKVLEQLQAEGYPYDFVLINAATGDNGAPRIQIVENATEWNNQHTDSEVRVATFTEFFDYAVQSGQEIPVFSGDAPNWWSWSFAASATGGYFRSRDAQILLPAAEAAASIGSAVQPSFDYPAADLRRAYINNLLFEDHNLGVASQDDAAGAAMFWERKMGWVNAARDTARSVLDAGLDAWLSSIQTADDKSVVVFNMTPWERSDLAVISMEDLEAIGPVGASLVDVETGEEVPLQYQSSGDAVFLAANVPSFGFRRFRIVQDENNPPVALEGSVMENDNYRVEVDATTGRVTGLFDKQMGIELTKGNGRFAQYVMNGSYPSATIVSTDSGDVLQRLVLAGVAPGSSTFRTEIVLPNHDKRVEISTTWDKNETSGTENIDFVFDLALTDSELDYEIPFGHVRVFEDELSGFQSNHYGSQRWSEITNSEATVVLSSSGPGLHAYSSGSFTGNIRFLTSFNNGNTAYRAGVGVHEARFGITSRVAAADPVASTRFSHSHNLPLRSRVIGAQTGSIASPTHSFLRFVGGDLFVSTFKRADDGNGFILRVFNPSDESQDVSAVFHDEVLFATETTLLEENRSPLGKSGSEVTIQLGPFETKTIRVDLAVASAVEGSIVEVGSLAIEGIYPNPTTGGATIRYRVGQPARVRVDIYDVLGRRVNVIEDFASRPGSNEIKWRGSEHAAAGVYLVTVESVSADGKMSRETATLTLAR